MTYLERGAKINVIREKEGIYIFNNEGVEILNPSHNYSIYLRNVKFVDNKIHGRFLGNETNLIDEYSQFIEHRQGKWFLTTHNEIVIGARLIVVNNTNESNSIAIIN